MGARHTIEAPPARRAVILAALTPIAIAACGGSVPVDSGSRPCPSPSIEGLQLSMSPAPVREGALDLGRTMPGVEARLNVTFLNNGAQPFDLRIETRPSSEFRVVGGERDWVSLALPAQFRDEGGLCSAGSASVELAATPKAAGAREAHFMMIARDFAANSAFLFLKARVDGIGPDIEVDPTPFLDVGEVAWSATGSPGTQRSIVVRNAGVPPDDPDAGMNLRLGRFDESGQWVPGSIASVMPFEGTDADEIAVAVKTLYDPQLGLDFKPGSNLVELTVNIAARSAGWKSALISIHSNDTDEPSVPLLVTAQAVNP